MPHQKYPAARSGLPDLQCSLVFLGVVPAVGGSDIGKFDHDDPLGLRLAFEQFDAAAAHDEPPAETGDAGGCERAVLLVSDRIGHLNIGDQIGGHRLLV